MPRKLTDADRKRILKLKTVNKLSNKEISEVTGIPKTTIFDNLQQVAKSDAFQYFQDNKDKVFEALQVELINLADSDALKTMLSKRGFTDVAILQDKIQALRGQAVNVSEVQVRVLIDNIVEKCATNQLQSVPSGSLPAIEHDPDSQIIDIQNNINDIDKIE